MSDTQPSSDHGPTTTYVTDPVTGDRTDREGVMRDLYALVQFYVDHPDHPLPWSITVHHTADIAGVDRVAAAYSSKKAAYGEPDGHYQTDHYLVGTSVPITLTVSRHPNIGRRL